HRKAEASFAHSKRFAHHDIAAQVGASMFEGATEPRGSVWSARSLLPLWRVGRQHCSLTDSIDATQKVRCSRGNVPDIFPSRIWEPNTIPSSPCHRSFRIGSRRSCRWTDG